MLTPLTTDEKRTLFLVMRMLLYIAVLIGTTVVMWQIGHIYHGEAMQEHGVIETMQLIILIIAALLYGIGAYFNREWRPILILLASLCVAAAVRENDAYFEEVLPTISWKFCWLFPAAALAYAISCGKRARQLFFRFLRTDAFSLLICAMIIIVPVAQCIGHRTFIADVINNNDMLVALTVRRLIEEPLELLGYIMILLAGIEFFIAEGFTSRSTDDKA